MIDLLLNGPRCSWFKAHFKYEEVNIKKTYDKHNLKTKDVVKELKARKVDTDGMDPESSALAWRGGSVFRKGQHVFEAAYRDQLFSNEFTASDKKKYTATVKFEADKSINNPFPASPNVSDATVDDAFEMSFVDSLPIGQDKALLIGLYWNNSDGEREGHRIAISHQRPPLLYDPNYGRIRV